MPIAQILTLLYAGMLLESPQKRQQFMGFINNAGVSVEKIISNSMNRGGAVNVPEPAAPEEPAEFR